MIFQRLEHATTHAEGTCITPHPHPFYFADATIFDFQRTAADRLTREPGD
jgi:hypothetical protein